MFDQKYDRLQSNQCLPLLREKHSVGSAKLQGNIQHEEFSNTGNLEKKKPDQSAATATAAPNVETAKEIIEGKEIIEKNVRVRHLA